MGELDKHYKLLGVSSTATIAELQVAYRRLIFEWHPDRNNGGNTSSNRRFLAIQDAWKSISDHLGISSNVHGEPSGARTEVPLSVGVAVKYSDEAARVLALHLSMDRWPPSMQALHSELDAVCDLIQNRTDALWCAFEKIGISPNSKGVPVWELRFSASLSEGNIAGMSRREKQDILCNFVGVVNCSLDWKDFFSTKLTVAGKRAGRDKTKLELKKWFDLAGVEWVPECVVYANP